MHRHLQATVVAATALSALAVSGDALAEPSPASHLGQRVAACAQAHLGEREGAPAVTCTHDGVEMTFDTFGAMAQHMTEHHA